MAKKFERPANLQELEPADLEKAVNDAYAQAEALAAKDAADLTDEEYAELTDLHGFLTEARAENEVREQALADKQAKLEEIRNGLAPKEEAPAEGAAPAAEGATGEADAEAAAVEAAAQAEAAEAAAAPAPVQEASIKRPIKSFAARAAKVAPAAEAPAPAKTEDAVSAWSLVAGSDAGSGFSNGQTFATLEDGAKIIQKQLNAMPKGLKGVRHQNSALVINLPENEFSDANPAFTNPTDLLLAAGNEERLDGGSLVAAGGWGAPSEQKLDFCELESIEGLISLPEISITRGGISYTKGPVFADVLANSTGFWDMDEATAEAGTELKTSLRPEIPTFTEERLDAVGVMMEAGLLLRQGWPEVIARYSSMLLTAHQYKLAQKKIAGILGFTGAAKAAGPGFGNALDILHVLELVATGERQRTFMSPKQTLEALIPHWVKNVVRVDMANRNGVEFKDVTDAEIDRWFTARNIKVQWITAWQNIVIDGATGIAKKYPDTVEIVLYPAGTYVVGTAPVITLDTIYDSVNLKKNDYVELFVEQGILVTNPCGDGVRISLPLYANGQRAQDTISNNFGTAAV
ncbi:major capsid hexamer protein [Arthrobacter phage Pureglobe5]|nr:major capsid hexamer protein [Arthrobacter phage Beagle]UYL87391.1 major capsid hexamer protein [Arthrobacter phage Pureglobe5]